MKRFTSPLTKIHALCEQQSQMARLELLRCQGALHAAERGIAAAEQALDAARLAAAATLRKPGPFAAVLGTRSQIVLAQEGLQAAQRARDEARRHLANAQANWETCRSKAERLEELIHRQRQTHRQQALREQQIVMDDASAARWTAAESTVSEVSGHG
jgi:flagellar export protein FliJ